MKIENYRLTALALVNPLLVWWTCSVAHAGTNLVINGGFEQPPVPLASYVSFPAPTSFLGWTVWSGSVDVVGTNFYANASGLQSLDLNTYVSGGVYQDITNSPGEQYRLRFAFGANTAGIGDASSGPALKRMEVRWGTNTLVVLEHDVTGRSRTSVGWREFTFSVPGTGLDRLSFLSLTPGSAGPALDNVSLTLASEPINPVDGLSIERAVQVCWPTESGRIYQVQWASSADTNVWTYLGPPVTGDDTTNCICDPIGSNAMRIYRVSKSQ